MQKKELRIAPQLLCPLCLFVALKDVTQCELHQASGLRFTKRRLRVRELSKSRRRLPTENEWIDVQAGAVEAGEPLRVGDIEHLPAEG